jgi:hypothetical protein
MSAFADTAVSCRRSPTSPRLPHQLPLAPPPDEKPPPEDEEEDEEDDEDDDENDDDPPDDDHDDEAWLGRVRCGVWTMWLSQ